MHKIGGFLTNLFDSRELAENADCNNKAIPYDIFDCVFVAGDLNFRVNSKEDTIFKYIQDK